MVIVAFNILTRHLELILSTNQGNGHEYVQVYVFPVLLLLLLLFIIIFFIFFNVSEGKEIKKDEKLRYNVKDNENRILHYFIQFLR